MSFHVSVPAQRGGDDWHLLVTQMCSDSVIGSKLTDTEKVTIKSMLSSRGKTCDMGVKHSALLKEKPRLYKMWNFSQAINEYYCMHPMCKVKYLVCRKESFLALYERGVHYHSSTVKKKAGLPQSLKTFVEPFIGQKNGVKRVMGSLLLFPEQHANAILGGLSLEDFRGDTKAKRSLIRYMSWEKGKRSAERTSLQSVARIGLSQLDLAQWLDLRMMSVDEIANLSDSACRESPGDIIVLSHSLNENRDGRWCHISFMCKETVPLLRAAAAATANVMNGMLAEIDYTCGIETDNLVQLGNVGFSDCRRRFIPTIYDLNKTENSIGAGRILSLFAMLVKKMDGHCGIALKDAAMALSKACNDNNLLEADCLAHKARMKSWSTRSSGTRGSLETYCLKIGASNMEIKILTSIMLGLDSLPTQMEWTFGVALLELHLYKENFSFATNEKAMQHLMKCYFPSVPRYGPIHSPCCPHSTQGLEKSWDYTKIGTNVMRDLMQSGGIQALMTYVANKSLLNHNPQDYSWKPFHDKNDWEAVRSFVTFVPANFKHVSIYIDGVITSSHMTLVDLGKGNVPFTNLVVIYVPYRSIIRNLYTKILRKEPHKVGMNFTHYQINRVSDSRIINEVHQELAKMIQQEVPCALDDENIFEYLLRRGSRNPMDIRGSFIHRGNGNRARKMRVRKEMNERNEYDKWSIQMDDEIQSGVESHAKIADALIIENAPEKKKDIELPLKVANLGRYARVCILRGGHDELLDSTQDDHRVTCTCAVFRASGTCDETKLFGWLFLNRGAPSSCMPHVFEGNDAERLKVIENYVLTTELFERPGCTSRAPVKDPWTE